MNLAMKITIRKAGYKDIPHIMSTIIKAKAMGNAAPPFYFRWIVRNGIAIIAEKEQKTAGFLVAEVNNKIAYTQLIYLFVQPKFRNQGIGSALMKYFLKTCHKKGVKYIDLHAQNKALGFYKKFGFRPEGKFAALYKKI